MSQLPTYSFVVCDWSEVKKLSGNLAMWPRWTLASVTESTTGNIGNIIPDGEIGPAVLEAESAEELTVKVEAFGLADKTDPKVLRYVIGNDTFYAGTWVQTEDDWRRIEETP